ncbi:MAG: cysteine desulfurase NifS [Proteobacteria bacterium]|nr:cysteine desulfurase NifS [Pseudomonadota bacterium]
MKPIYLDHSATTPIRPEVLEAMFPYFSDIFGNASSIHTFGQKAKKALEDSREKAASILGALPEEIVFTSGGTEANNLAIKGKLGASRDKGTHIITSSVEHAATLNTCRYVEREGVQVTYLPVDNFGKVDPGDVEKAITDRTALISIIHANNEVGTIEPIEEIGEIARDRGVSLHTDAVQSVGKIPVNVDDLKLDFLSLSGHKIHGPKGIGILYVRKGVPFEPLFQGGHHEWNRRPGTQNIPAIVGLAKAMELAEEEMEEVSARERSLGDAFWKAIQTQIEGVHLNGHRQDRVPHILNVSFDSVDAESVILNLDLKGIAVSTGSACTSGSLEESHVLQAMGLPNTRARGAVRFSLGRETTEEELDNTTAVLVETINRLRSMSRAHRNRKKEGKLG